MDVPLDTDLMVSNKPLIREFTATLLLIVLYMACSQVSIPYINQQALTAFFDSKYVVSGLRPDHISILSLGLRPYMSAYVLVEIASLFVPFLKKLRHGDYRRRRKLKLYALCLTFVVAVWQGTALINCLSEMTTNEGVHILKLGNNTAYAVLLLTIAAGVFFLIIVSELISAYGIGNGISIIILSGLGARATLFRVDLSRLFTEVGLFPFLLSFSVILVVTLSTIILLRTKVNIPLKHREEDQPVNFFQLNLCPSGNIPIFFGTTAVMLPVTFVNFFGRGRDLADKLAPGTLFYDFSSAIFICMFSYLFAWLFFHPKKRLDKMDERGWSFPGNLQITYDYLTRHLLIYNLPWTLLLCGLAIIPHILIVKARVPFYIGGSALIIALVIILDIIARFNVLRTLQFGRLVKIAELHDVYDASMIKKHLKSEGIIFHLHGYYHRHLLYFFGPYIDMSLLVAEEHRESAQKIIRTYYNGLGLV